MSRPDLLALTPQALASLSNMGLVKRAQKDAEQGRAPKLEELSDGTVVGVFEDGATARLVPGKGLKDSPCNCNASTVCRHRVAVALAYPAFAQGASEAAPSEGAEVASEAVWSPGAVEDEALMKLLPRRSYERAAALRRQGFIARVQRGAFVGEDVPSVALSTCTVRFLVPRELGYARCDCATGTGCEHVALAVWAFREADGKDSRAREVSVEVAGTQALVGEGGAALEAALELARFLVLEGAQNAASGAGTRLALARTAVSEVKMAWLRSALEEAEELLTAYHSRSARYAPGRLAGALTEVFARARAARGQGALPARAVLGMDEAPETKLEHLRLVSLGARLYAEGRERRVEVILADPAAAGLLVLRRSYTYEETQTPEDGPALGRRLAVPGATVEALARGQVVTSGATRLPNRQVVFSTRGLQRTSVTPQAGEWGELPAALRVTDVRELEAKLREGAPRFLRPRLLAEHVHVFEVARVLDVAYAPGAQSVRARVEDAGGRPFLVELVHRRVAPGALDALAEGLAGRPGRLRYLSGEARRTDRGLLVEPLALVCEGPRVVVLDLQPVVSAEGLLVEEDTAALAPLPAALAEVQGCLADAVHQGLRHAAPTWGARLGAATLRVRELGLGRLAEVLAVLGERQKAARASGSSEDESACASAWAEASLRATLALEQLG